MSIRYFATNRDRENLGRVAKGRKHRIKLQKGGYHFVNMEAYMSHYLADVDAKTMPSGAVVINSKNEVFDDFLDNAKIGTIVICVHGFNVHFHDAQTWFGILTDSLRHTDELANKVVTDPAEQDRKLLASKRTKAGSLTAFIGFSWPSNGDAFSYQSDQSEAIGSADVLANLITRIRSLSHKPSVNLICHSMGNFLACNMFSHLISGVAQPQPATSKAAKALKTRVSRWESGKDIAAEDLYFVDRYIMLGCEYHF